MKKEEISEAMKDVKFVEKIVDIKSAEEMQKAFAEKSINLSLDEAQAIISTIEKMVNKGSTELSEEELKEIAGGMKLTIVQKISLAMAAALGTTIAALSLNQMYQILKK